MQPAVARSAHRSEQGEQLLRALTEESRVSSHVYIRARMPLWSIRAPLKIVSLNLLHCYQFIDTVRCIVLPILSLLYPSSVYYTNPERRYSPLWNRAPYTYCLNPPFWKIPILGIYIDLNKSFFIGRLIIIEAVMSFLYGYCRRRSLTILR